VDDLHDEPLPSSSPLMTRPRFVTGETQFDSLAPPGTLGSDFELPDLPGGDTYGEPPAFPLTQEFRVGAGVVGDSGGEDG
jgi:hypothetical protein